MRGLEVVRRQSDLTQLIFDRSEAIEIVSQYGFVIDLAAVDGRPRV